MVCAAELLVVLAKGGSGLTKRDIEQKYHLLQSVSPRVFVIGKPAADMPLPVVSRELLVVTDQAVPDAIMDTLTDMEKLWVEAWLQGRSAKQRTGDGLPWDAAGFLPPDLPGE